MSLAACPECGLPAEIEERFWLNSTDGLIEHGAVSCVAGHYFRMALDRLPVADQDKQPQKAGLSSGTVPSPQL